MTHRTYADRFWGKVERTEGCWNWLGAKTAKGYGQLRIAGQAAYAHRLSALMSGLDPTGSVVDHICHNPSCVRPDHLRLVTAKQNSENLSGAHKDSSSGVRGVSWDSRNRKWQARVFSAGRQASKRFETLEQATAWAKAKRNEMFTHNDLDRR